MINFKGYFTFSTVVVFCIVSLLPTRRNQGMLGVFLEQILAVTTILATKKMLIKFQLGCFRRYTVHY